jgi:ATP-dependent DNA ligase
MTTKLQKGLSATPKDLTYPCYAEGKIDGVRCHASLLPSGEVQYLSYAGKPLYNLSFLTPQLLPFMERYGDLDMEILYNEDFKQTIQYVRSHTLPKGFSEALLTAYLLDLPDHKGPQSARRKALEDAIVRKEYPNLDLPWSCTHTSQESLEEYLRAIFLRGREGLVVKDPDALYKQGGRTKAWLKLKRAETEDGVILAYNEAVDQKGNPKGELGSLVVQLESGIICSASSSKLTRAERVALWLTRDTLPGQWAEVRYMQVASAGGARHPVFIRLREAKQ